MNIAANATYKGEAVRSDIAAITDLKWLRGLRIDYMNLHLNNIRSVDDINEAMRQLHSIVDCFNSGGPDTIQYPPEIDPDREEQKDEGHAVPTPDADWTFVEGDQVMLKSGGPILTVTTVTNGWIDCIYYDESQQLLEQGFGWAVVVKLV